MSGSTNDGAELEPIPTTGYGVHGRHGWFTSDYDAARAAAGQHRLAREGNRARFYHLVQMLRLTRGLPGDTAEAGCHRGMSSFLLCRERRREDPAFDGTGHRVIDSFEGLSEPTDADGEFSRKRFGEGAFTNTSVEHVRCTLGEFPGVELIQGWIPGVFGELVERVYRFVHIDVDLHDPTLESLRYFLPRMTPGGLIVVDDYGPWPEGQWPGCRAAVEAFCGQHDLPLAALDTGNAVVRVPYDRS